jgi:hypothetical protein
VARSASCAVELSIEANGDVDSPAEDDEADCCCCDCDAVDDEAEADAPAEDGGAFHAANGEKPPSGEDGLPAVAAQSRDRTGSRIDTACEPNADAADVMAWAAYWRGRRGRGEGRTGA